MKPILFKCIVSIELLTLLGIAAFAWLHSPAGASRLHSRARQEAVAPAASPDTEAGTSAPEKEFIKWVDFKVTSQAMNDAYQYDLKAHDTDTPIDWVSLLAVLGAKYGGDFKNYKSSDMSAIADKILNKESTLEQLTADMKYFHYYDEAYHAVLGGYVGEYRLEGSDEIHYGLKAFSPIAKGFPYNDYDDFGTSRSFGYRRQHLGHDMMGQIGTPVIAVESGYVECLGWNRYGGWRIGIRSFDKKRYYYYAHLRQNRPYAEGLKEGDYVTAGDVIGYMGHTGYSDKENVNNIKTVHLHVGLQLIFDESQKDGNNEIWVDFYQLAGFLSGHRCEVERDDLTKEWDRKYDMKDPVVPDKF